MPAPRAGPPRCSTSPGSPARPPSWTASPAPCTCRLVGRNWDALADSLGDLPARPGADRGLLLLVTGWQGYAETRPEEWAVAREVMDAATGPELCVLLALGGSH